MNEEVSEPLESDISYAESVELDESDDEQKHLKKMTTRRPKKTKLQPKKSLQAARISPRKALIPKIKVQRPHFSSETGHGIKLILGKKSPNGRAYTRETERRSKASKRVQLKLR